MAERWILTRGDAYYPKCLEDLHSPPRVLYGIGDPTLLSTPMLSVIGARRATPYGIAIAEMTARVAVDYGVIVVSGGAMGCDFAAGMSALSGGGKTIVVLGCGADVIYPRSSEPLILRGGSVFGSVENPASSFCLSKKKCHYCSTWICSCCDGGRHSLRNYDNGGSRNRFRQNTVCNSGINFFSYLSRNQSTYF